MHVAPQLVRSLVGIGAGSAALAGGATALWKSASGPDSWQERVAVAGYTPGFAGFAAAALAAPLLLIPGARPVAGAVVAGGLAAGVGMLAGTALTRGVLGAPDRAVLKDDQLPPPDAAKARALADDVLAQIDRSSDDLVLWVPGTALGLPTSFVEGVQRNVGRDADVVRFATHYGYDVIQDSSNTAEALRLVLGELATDGRPDRRIFLGGESQGAWSITQALADEQLAEQVERVVLTGNPGMNEQQYDGAAAGKVLEITDPGDAVGQDYRGDARMVLDGGLRMVNGEPEQGIRLLGTLANNPVEAGRAVTSAVRIGVLRQFEQDPHNYDAEYDQATKFLGTGRRN